MKKATMFTFYLALWIIALCSIGMIMTYVNDAIQASGFFGDVKLSKPTEVGFGVDPEHEWGPRHYWYFWMCSLLFALSIVRCIIWIDHYWKDK